MRRVGFLGPVLLLAMTSLGCRSVVSGEQQSLAEAMEGELVTKDDALRAFGAPDNVHVDGTDRVYYFVRAEASGGGFGIGASVLQTFWFARTHDVKNTVMVRVGADGRIKESVELDAEAIRDSSLWPGN